MNIKQTIQLAALGAILMLSVALFLVTTTTSAACGGVETAFINCDQGADGDTPEETGIWGVLILTINIMVGGVGVLAIAGVVYGSILYTSAGGNPAQIQKAKGIFVNVVIGVVAFAAMYTLLNFLIPGGVFN